MSDEDLKECASCKRKFPWELLAPFCLNGITTTVCPLCALQIRNKEHGLPPNTPFHGPRAQRMWQQAKEFIECREGQ